MKHQDGLDGKQSTEAQQPAARNAALKTPESVSAAACSVSNLRPDRVEYLAFTRQACATDNRDPSGRILYVQINRFNQQINKLIVV